MADTEGILWSAVRERIAGQRVVVVTNRKDKALKRELEDALGVKIKWVVAEGPRKVGSLVKSIKSGSVDVVLACTGWIKHKVDGTIAPEARKAGTLYVRVDKGRPLAVLMALARELGVE